VKNLSADSKTNPRIYCNKELSLHVIGEALDGRVPVKHNARRTVTTEIPVDAFRSPLYRFELVYERNSYWRTKNDQMATNTGPEIRDQMSRLENAEPE